MTKSKVWALVIVGIIVVALACVCIFTIPHTTTPVVTTEDTVVTTVETDPPVVEEDVVEETPETEFLP